MLQIRCGSILIWNNWILLRKYEKNALNVMHDLINNYIARYNFSYVICSICRHLIGAPLVINLLETLKLDSAIFFIIYCICMFREVLMTSPLR